jgi:hypothetical protein
LAPLKVWDLNKCSGIIARSLCASTTTTADTLYASRPNKELNGRGQAASQRRQHEQTDAEHEDFLAPELIAQGTADEDQRGKLKPTLLFLQSQV